MASFENKVFAITGAASGIGLATAHLLVSRGATVSLADNRQGPLHTAVASISERTASAKIYAYTVDVTKLAEVVSWLDETVEQFGKLDGAANLAGIVGPTIGVEVQHLEKHDWNTVIDVNLNGVFNCLKAELQRIQHGGSIINAASTSGLRGYAGTSAYCASKVSDSLT